MRIDKKVIFLIIAVFVLTFSLTGCFDLGEGTEDDEDYCETYSVRLIDKNSDSHSYDMGDFYNKEAVNDFKTPMTEDDRNEYSYILIKSEKSVSLGEIAVYFDSTVEATVNVKVFILNEDEIPTKVYTGEGGNYSDEDCNEPDISKAVAETSFKVAGQPDKWKEMYLTSWSKNGEPKVKRMPIEEGQYIVFRIDNNCYDPAKRIFDKAKKAWQAVVDAFNEKVNAYQALLNDASASDAQRNEAKAEMDASAAEKNSADLEYMAAEKQYEKDKSEELVKVPFRITAILINAE
jgi:hypothetical protein